MSVVLSTLTRELTHCPFSCHNVSKPSSMTMTHVKHPTTAFATYHILQSIAVENPQASSQLCPFLIIAWQRIKTVRNLIRDFYHTVTENNYERPIVRQHWCRLFGYYTDVHSTPELQQQVPCPFAALLVGGAYQYSHIILLVLQFCFVSY